MQNVGGLLLAAVVIVAILVLFVTLFFAPIKLYSIDSTLKKILHELKRER